MPSPGPTDSAASGREPRWRDALRDAVRNVEELARLLELPAGALGAFEPGAREFPLLVPQSYVRRMRRRDPGDPLLLQVLPRTAERREVPGFGADPLRETEIASDGFLQKYPQRALLITTEACPVHCRYCFRRAFPYRSQLASRRDWATALQRLQRAGDIGEVILSGGDPLSLSTQRLRGLFDAAARIESIHRIRIHTRFPIVVPERVDEELLSLLSETPLETVIVVHCNHPNEIDTAVEQSLRSLQRSGGLLLNQSVLLAGVNDDAGVLAALSERLLACGALPYYLHLLDRVAGTAHFEVGEGRGRALIAALRSRLPGYMVPRLAREVPGRASKDVLC